MTPRVRRTLEEATDDLLNWWSSETDQFQEFVLSVLAALPGGDKLEDFVEPAKWVGWKELELVCNLFSALNDASDVEYVVSRIRRGIGGRIILPATRTLEDAADELFTWWSSETRQFRDFVLSVLAALPGGDKFLEDFVEPAEWVGWKELELVCNLFSALHDASDVEYVVSRIMEE